MKGLIILLFSVFILVCSINAQNTLSIQITNKTDSSSLNSTSFDMSFTPETTLKYTQEALDNNIEGKVWFTVRIDSNCNVDTVIITQSLGFGLDELVVEAYMNATVQVFIDGVPDNTCSFHELYPLFREFNSFIKFNLSD